MEAYSTGRRRCISPHKGAAYHRSRNARALFSLPLRVSFAQNSLVVVVVAAVAVVVMVELRVLCVTTLDGEATAVALGGGVPQYSGERDSGPQTLAIFVAKEQSAFHRESRSAVLRRVIAASGVGAAEKRE